MKSVTAFCDVSWMQLVGALHWLYYNLIYFAVSTAPVLRIYIQQDEKKLICIEVPKPVVRVGRHTDIIWEYVA
jgi:hypothetical protein